MRNLGIVLIILGLVAIAMGFFGLGGFKSLAILGVVMAGGGFLLYHRHRPKEVSGRG